MKPTNSFSKTVVGAVFAVGTAGGLAITTLTLSNLKLVTLFPSLLAFTVVSLVVGENTAEANIGVVYVVAALMHGVAFTALTCVLSFLRWTRGSEVVMRIGVVDALCAVVLYGLALLIPAGDYV